MDYFALFLANIALGVAIFPRVREAWVRYNSLSSALLGFYFYLISIVFWIIFLGTHLSITFN